MPRVSAGILMYRTESGRLEVLLVHPGGPFWTNKDAGAWTIPKGEVDQGEDLLACARREFQEELGTPADGDFLPLGQIKQKAGKIVHAWAVQGDLDTAAVRSNTFKVQWPPSSGQWRTFPEVDKAEWFDPATAREKINPAQIPFLDALEQLLKSRR